MSRVDLLILGAGPAGMAAALAARRHGLDVMVVDEQPEPGGQIWRGIETTDRRDAILGTAYVEGRAVVEAFRGCGATYRTGAQLWQIEPGFRAVLTSADGPEVVEAKTILLATGAQERPMPFPGWNLPGVMTIGSAQILLKTAGQIPTAPVWIAGSGPLALLYAVQLLEAGGRIAGFLDTSRRGRWHRAWRHVLPALRASGDLAKGLRWMAALRRRGTSIVRGVTGIEAMGAERIEAIRYIEHDGACRSSKAELLLVHEGVVPNIHPAVSVGCEMQWDTAQDCFRPQLDGWGESSRENLFVAGDSAGIAGARAALLSGELAGLRIAVKLGKLDGAAARVIAVKLRQKLRRERAIRPFLDALFKPRDEIFVPADTTVICRCEGITAGEIRDVATTGEPGPNQVKAATRAGMGPCQGRQCGYTTTRIISAVQRRPPCEVGYLNIRPPLKPVTLGELALLRSAVGK